MLKLVLTGAVAAGALLGVSAAARAAESYTFALVPKNTNNPFFDQALAGSFTIGTSARPWGGTSGISGRGGGSCCRRISSRATMSTIRRRF